MSISGFPEFLPNHQIAFDNALRTIRNVFELHGFSPLDTPAVERISTLLAKGNDNEIYGIHRIMDEQGGKKDLGLRFDLTIPLARYVAEHYGQLVFPYKRYHIAPVWRGERPQSGRYRQFYQCDIDIVNTGTLAPIYDAEVIYIIDHIFTSLGLKNFKIKINNRKLLSGLLGSFGCGDISAIMRIIDKADKVSLEEIESELRSNGLTDSHVQTVTKLITTNMTNGQFMEHLLSLCDNEEFCLGISELQQLIADCRMLGIDKERLQICPSLARGLGYYTGTIFEVILTDYPELGSVCGGGRYANLAATFGKAILPGVGVSIGISRMIPGLISAGFLKCDAHTTTQVLMTTQNQGYIQQYINIAQQLRTSGIKTEVYLESKPLAAQLKYADSKNIAVAIIADGAEFDARSVILKNIRLSTQEIVLISDLLAKIIPLIS